MEYIVQLLREHGEESFADFQRNLLPTVPPESIIGVRTPALRKLAAQVAKEEVCQTFLNELPHTYFEENQLHGFIISEIRDMDICLRELKRFLPYVDNWATCDQTSPKVFKKRAEEALPFIYECLQSDHTYTKRFAIGMLMQHFLGNRFDTKYLDMVSGIISEDYYVNMEIAWYMATALAKQWDATIPYLTRGRMGKWVHNKTIQKARESSRITPEQKAYLKTLKKTQ